MGLSSLIWRCSLRRGVHHCSLLLVLACALVVGSSDRASAQLRLENFHYDSVFHMGGHALRLPRLGHDSLRTDIFFLYHQDIPEARRFLLGDLPTDPTNVWVNRTAVRNARYFRELDSLGLGLITGLGSYMALYQRARVADNYLDMVNANVQQFEFGADNRAAGTLEPAMLGQMKALKITRDTSVGETMMVDAARYVSYHAAAFGFSSQYAGYGLDPDSAHFLKVVVNMQVDSSEMTEDWFEQLPNNTVLMNVEVYRRIDTLQSDTCRCALYEPFDTLAITKGMYRDSASFDSLSRFPALTFWLDMRRYDGRGWLNPSNSTRYHFRVDSVSGTWFGGASDTTQCTFPCEGILLNLRDTVGKVNPGSRHIDGVYESDLTYRVTTTRKVTVSLLRVRTAMHLLDVLERGTLDTFMRADLDTLFTPVDTTLAPLHRVLRRFHVLDEPYLPTFVSYGEISRRMQRHLRELDPQKRGVFSNATGNLDGFRLFSGDLDTSSTREKPIHLVMEQNYRNYQGWVPARYANPDLMSDTAMRTWWRVSDSSSYPKRVALQSDYATVTSGQQAIFGSAYDWQSIEAAVGWSTLLVPRLVRGVQVTRKRYRSIVNDSVPFWNVVQLSGYKVEGKSIAATAPTGYTTNPKWDDLPPVHPEAIAAQAWLGLNCGIDGMFWHDMISNGIDFGIVDDFYGVDSANKFVEYGTLHATGQLGYDLYPAAWTLPRMWVGMRSRYAMVKRIGNYFRDTILPVYEQLVRPGRQISVHDTRMSFTDIPMVTTVQTRLPQRYVFGVSGGYVDSTATDPQSSTFIELTVFDPKPWGQVGGVSLGAEDRAKYLLLTNRRTFPDDTLHYGATAQGYGADSVGLGRVDARRPLIRLKNSTEVLADSFLIVKVGDSTWKRRVALDSLVALDWLEPGWGAMYRVEPVPSGGTAQSVAWNNGVRAEHLGSDSNGCRVVTYERDSIAYLRLYEPHYGWGREMMLTSPSDTVIVGTRRRGRTIQPALAFCRTDDLATSARQQRLLVIWERLDTLNRRTVQGRMREVIWATSGAVIHQAAPDSAIMTFSPPVSLSINAPGHYPSVTGTMGGWLIAWGGFSTGVNLLAIRDGFVNGTSYPTSDDTLGLYSLARPLANIGSQSRMYGRWPTLASVPLWQQYRSADYQKSAGALSGQPVEAFWTSHLAYQQGRVSELNNQWIEHQTVGVDFLPVTTPYQSPAPIRLVALNPETVTGGIIACNFLHPSIAADSERVAVAFETHNGYIATTLRFRPALAEADTQQVIHPWRTPVYRWADYRAVRDPRWKIPLTSAHRYERPSVTEFPARPLSALSTTYEGGLVWQWTNESALRKNPGRLYRFGSLGVDTIQDGRDPTMVLNTTEGSTRTNALASSGVLRRDPDSLWMLRPNNTRVWPLIVDNTSLLRSRLFTTPPVGTSIVARFNVARTPTTLYDIGCAEVKPVNVGIIVHGIAAPPTGGGTPPTPAPSPTFFGVLDTTVQITAVDHPVRVTTSSAFTTTAAPLPTTLLFAVDSTMSTWLTTQDTLGGGGTANIGAVMELVQVSNDSVVWKSDTLWARALIDTAIVRDVLVPSDTVVAQGTAVRLRVRALVTKALLPLDYEAGWTFSDSTIGDPTFAPKRVQRQNTIGTPEAEAMLSVVVHPNPVRAGSGEVVVRALYGGEAVVEVVDALGRPVAESMRVELVGDEFRVPFDASALTAGTYTVSVRQGSQRVSTQLVVTR